MSTKRDKLVSQLSSGEMSEFGLGDSELDNLHSELGFVEEETVEEEVVEKPVKPKASTPRKRNTTATKPKASPKKKQVTPRDLLKNIKIDINNIEFSDKSPLEKVDDIEFILNGKPSFQVVANQSGYIAHMESIRLADINAITNSTMDMYASKQKLYKTVFSKINTTSVGKMDYKTWLRVTSFFDLPSLMYGIYNQTFPGDTNFEVTCRHCQQPTDVIVNNETLIDVKDEATYSKLGEIVNHAKKPEDLLSESLVNKYTRSVLPEDKILVDIQTPSLWNHLELLASIDKRQLEELDDVIGTMLFIKNLYVLDITALQQGKVRYSEVTDKNQIVNILRNLEVNDAKALGDAISDRTEKYAIYYQIKDHNCSKCGNSVGDIPVDMETMLFTQILQM
jgi:hypothetical protein